MRGWEGGGCSSRGVRVVGPGVLSREGMKLRRRVVTLWVWALKRSCLGPWLRLYRMNANAVRRAVVIKIEMGEWFAAVAGKKMLLCDRWSPG